MNESSEVRSSISSTCFRTGFRVKTIQRSASNSCDQRRTSALCQSCTRSDESWRFAKGTFSFPAFLGRPWDRIIDSSSSFFAVVACQRSEPKSQLLGWHSSHNRVAPFAMRSSKPNPQTHELPQSRSWLWKYFRETKP